MSITTTDTDPNHIVTVSAIGFDDANLGVECTCGHWAWEYLEPATLDQLMAAYNDHLDEADTG